VISLPTAALQKNDGAEWSVREQEVEEGEQSGERGHRNRPERGAAFSPLTLRSRSAHILTVH